ncbi:MAG: UvrD-helicase domain-containing protein [Alphaproteobacteria bacterium]|nr:UvrD-helicase domain-containing protein [Alphaproteobacteria bacterium]
MRKAEAVSTAATAAQSEALNGIDAQRQAVEVQDGPVLVLAGAGTGKTRVLTTRLAYLLASGAAKPWTVLSVTFTNKAAKEMRNRVAAIIGPMAEQIWLGTFHALCARLLRRHAEIVGLQSNFTILDADDQVRLLKQLLQAEGIDDKKWPARQLMGVIQRWKDRGLTPEKVSRTDSGDLAGGKLRELYAQYQDRLLILNAADFGDLLLHCLTLFQEHPDVLRVYQERFSHILVDEYQDTNVAQYLWLRLLAQGRQNICCVGDDDQSIYGWRGAEVGNILKFEQDFPGAQVIRLEQNYRSTSRVLAAASGLIRHNEGRLGKTLWTEGDEGDLLILRGVWDGEEEARVVGEQIEARQRAGTPLQQMAILVRAGFQTREFEERFLTLGVPYQVIGGARFYERMEIRDAIAYLRVINQPNDDLALERIINKPKRGIGAASLQALHQLARAEQISFWTAISKIIETDELRPAARKSLTTVVEDFQRWRSLVETEDHADLAGMVLDDSGYTGMLKADKSPEAAGRLENLRELVSALKEFENLGGFLEHISLVMENAETTNVDQVSIMTLHAAKGLEFDVVFLPGWEEGVFPNQRSLDENGAIGLEEERRLAYVGITRARKSVEITHAANRRLYGTWQSAIPSRFVGELPQEHVEVATESGLFGGQTSRSFGSDNLWDEPQILPPRGVQRVSGSRYGPGFGRRDGTSTARAPTVNSEGHLADRSSVTAFSPGDRVFHQKFGMGTVSVADGDKLNIAFDKAGDKKVIASFVSRP